MTPQDLTLTDVTSVGHWLPLELVSCAGLTALRLQRCSSSSWPPTSAASSAAYGFAYHRLPEGVYLQTLMALQLVDCQFAEFPRAISVATALHMYSLTCTNKSGYWGLLAAPDAVFKATQAAEVLTCLPRLVELRLKARDWAAEEWSSLAGMLPDVRMQQAV